jgi:hypothetical protein
MYQIACIEPIGQLGRGALSVFVDHGNYVQQA